MPAAPDRRQRHRGDLGRLQRILRINAALTAGSAIALLAGAHPLADILGTGHPGWIRVVGAALAVFAVEVVLLSRGGGGWVRAGAILVAGADVMWVAASVGAVGAGWFEPMGVVLVLATAAVVGGLAAAEVQAIKGASGTLPSSR